MKETYQLRSALRLLILLNECEGAAPFPPLTWQSQNQHCVLACTAGIASWCAVNRDDLALSLPSYKSSELGRIRHSLTAPETPGAWSHTCLVNARNVHSGWYWNCIVSV